MKNKTIFSLMFGMIFLFGMLLSISATTNLGYMGDVYLNQNATIVIPSNASACNISSIRDFHNTALIVNTPMSKEGIEYIYNFTDTGLIGIYNGYSNCDDGTIYGYNFEVSEKPAADLFGVSFNSPIVLISLSIIFILGIFFIIKENPLWGGFLILIDGLILFFNHTNVIISLVISLVGIVFIFSEAGK